jgi:hypothetical protein
MKKLRLRIQEAFAARARGGVRYNGFCLMIPIALLFREEHRTLRASSGGRLVRVAVPVVLAPVRAVGVGRGGGDAVPGAVALAGQLPQGRHLELQRDVVDLPALVEEPL